MATIAHTVYTSIATSLISLFLELFPSVNGRFHSLQANQKEFIIFIISIAVVVAGYFGACAEIYVSEMCSSGISEKELTQVIFAWIIARGAMRETHRGTKAIKGVRGGTSGRSLPSLDNNRD